MRHRGLISELCKMKKVRRKRLYLVWFHLHEIFSKKQNYNARKLVSVRKRLGWGERLDCIGARKNLGERVNGNVLYYKCCSGGMPIFVKAHQIIYLKLVNVILCKLFLHRNDRKYDAGLLIYGHEKAFTIY